MIAKITLYFWKWAKFDSPSFDFW